MTEDAHEPKPGQEVFLKENPAFYLVRDAELALNHAQEAFSAGDLEHESSHARTATLMYFLALEGLINFAYEYCEVPRRRWKSWSIKDKWIKAAEECLPYCGEISNEHGIQYTPGDPVEGVAEDADLFARFLELKAVRNEMVHVQPAFSNITEDQIADHLGREEFHPLTRLPKRLVSVRYEHAQVAAEIYQAMFARLDQCLKGMLAMAARAPSVYEFIVDELPSGTEATD